MVDHAIVQALNRIVRKAGDAVLDIYYHQENLSIQHKSDRTPVTIGDLKANAVIEMELNQLAQLYPLLSEESDHAHFEERKLWHRYWLIDPLDGTQEFINRNDEFTINIALMENISTGCSYPIFGIVHVPVTNTSYWGGKGFGAFKQTGNKPAIAIRPRSFKNVEVVLLGSRSYGTKRALTFIKKLKTQYPTLEVKIVGSALKSCNIAEGLADIYPRFGPTFEWDTGAAQAIVEGAGALLLDSNGNRLSYNFKESLLNSDFMVVGDSSKDWSVYWNKDLFNNL